MTAEQIAPVVHEAMRAYQRILGQPVTPTWEESTWEKQSSIDGVEFALTGPRLGAQHERWMAARLADGWKWAPVKDAVAKTNPALVPFDELPSSEQAKDALVIAIALALKHADYGVKLGVEA